MHVWRYAGVCTLIAAGCFLSFGQTVRPAMSVDELVRLALDTNREYLAAKERIVEAQALMRQAGLRPAPTIEVEAENSAFLGGRGESEYSASYFHTFERGGKRAKRIAVAQIGLALAEADVQERQRQLVSDVRLRFIATASEQLKLATVRALLPAAEQTYELTVKRVELGDAAPLEQQLLFAESNRVLAQQALLAAASEAAVAELKAVSGVPAEQPLEIVPILDPPNRSTTLAQLQEHALNQRPDLRILRLLEQQTTEEAGLALAEGRPDITASAGYTLAQTLFDQFGLSDTGAPVPIQDTHNMLRFGVSIPLFNRNRAEAGVAAARSREAQHRLRREHLERTIPQEVAAAYRRWNGAATALGILRNGVIDPSQKSLMVIREAYRLGQLRMFDVLNEQRRLADLQLSYVDAQAEAARALVELERAVGGNLP